MGRYITGILLFLSFLGLLYATVPKCLPQLENFSGLAAVGEEHVFYIVEQKKEASVLYGFNELGLVSDVFSEPVQKGAGRIVAVTTQNGLYYLVRESEGEAFAAYALYRIRNGIRQTEPSAQFKLALEESVADLRIEGNWLYLTSIGENNGSAFVYRQKLEDAGQKIELYLEGYPDQKAHFTDAAYTENRLYVLTKEGRLSYFEAGQQEMEQDTKEGCISWIRGCDGGLLCMGLEGRRLYILTGLGETELEQGNFFITADRAADKRMLLLEQETDGSGTVKVYQDRKWRFLKALSCTLPVFFQLAGRTVVLDAVFVLLAGVMILVIRVLGKQRKSMKRKLLTALVCGAAVPVLAVTDCAFLSVRRSLLREQKQLLAYCAANTTEALSFVEWRAVEAASFYQTTQYLKSCEILKRTKTELFLTESMLVYSDSGEVSVLAAEGETFGSGISGIFRNKMKQAVIQAANTGSSQTVELDFHDRKWLFLVTPQDQRVRPEVFLLTGISLEEWDTAWKSELFSWIPFLVFSSLFLAGILAAAVSCYKKTFRTLSKELERAGNGETKLEDGALLEEEWKEIRNSLLRIGGRIKRQQDLGADMQSQCARFLPYGMEWLMGKNSWSEVQAGDTVRLRGTFALVWMKEPEELRSGRQTAEKMEQIQKLFPVIEEKKEETGGVHLTTESDLKGVTLFYPESTEEACRFGTELLSEVYAEKEEGNHLPVFLFLHLGTGVYGLAGTDKQAVPFLTSKKLEEVRKYFDRFRELGIRMVVTESVLEKLEGSRLYRYIGYVELEHTDQPCRFYEALEVYAEEERKAKIKTNRKFQEGLALFYRSDFYLARSCFAEVLKEFPKDRAAAWYLFRCEKLFQTEGNREAVFALFAE